MPYFTFQEGKIFEAGNDVNPKGRKITFKTKNEKNARGKLPQPGVGRRWVLIGDRESRMG